MPTGYEDIDNLQSQTNQLYDQQMEQQRKIADISTQQAIDELQRNKQEAEEQAEKTNRALYTDYQKQINPYGVNAEDLAEQGLGRSGLAESTRANYYNTYQNARTEAQNNANKIKADFDAKMVQARQNGDLQMAQAALNMYQQRVNDMYNLYNLKFNQDQFAYQKEQDTLSQSNWEKEYQQALQQAQWQQQFNQAQFDYQKERDRVADEQWQKEYDLSKKASSSGRRSGGSSSSGNNTTNVGDEISDYARNLANGINNLKGHVGYKAEEVRNQIANLVHNTVISPEEARYIYEQVGL